MDLRVYEGLFQFNQEMDQALESLNLIEKLELASPEGILFLLRFLRSNDEREQQVNYQALTFAFAGTLVFSAAIGLFQSFGFHPLSWLGIPPLMIILWSVGLILYSWRYRKRKQQVLEGKKLPELFRKPSVNFGQLADDGLAYSKRNKRSYRTDVPRFASLKEWFGSEPVEEPTPREIEYKLAKAAEKENWAPSTFNHYRSLMSLGYRPGILNRKVATNPARSVTHRREDNNRVRFLTEEEEKKLRKIVQTKWALHVPELDLAINTGLRKGSQYGLTWDMVDWTSRMLNISRTKYDEAVHVPLNDAAVAALKAVFKRGNGRGRVFRSSKTGEALENARHWFDDAVAEAKLKNFHWHDLRHTFASRLRMKGAPLEDIADLLGHKSLTMTRRYAHLGPNRLHEVVSLLKATDTTSDTEQTAVSSTVVQVSEN